MYITWGGCSKESMMFVFPNQYSVFVITLRTLYRMHDGDTVNKDMRDPSCRCKAE